MVDTLIRDQAEFTECRLMLWLIPKEGTKIGRRAGDERKASRRRAEMEQEVCCFLCVMSSNPSFEPQVKEE